MEENFVRKLTDSFKHHPVATGLEDEPYAQITSVRAKVNEGEIAVFGADKYFTMKIDDECSPELSEGKSSIYLHRNEDRADLHPRSRAKSGTLSVSSEASSGNGQTPLFPSFVRNPSQSKDKDVSGSRFFTGFACRGTCNDVKSVNIKRSSSGRGDQRKKVFSGLRLGMSDTKQSKEGIQQKDWSINQRFEKKSFSFEAKRERKQDIEVAKMFDNDDEPEEGRKSLEVFGLEPIKTGDTDIAANLERKLSVLTWDAIPKSPNLPIATLTNEKYEDMNSDASSDLFELENISSEMSTCMTATTIYAPSEASIEWSVVTASALDFAADTDVKKLEATNKTKATKIKDWGKGLPGGFLGCRSEKAVGVLETARRSANNENEKAKGFEFPQAQRSIASRVLPSSHPALSSIARYV